jgi:hypothetical protein
LANGVPKSHETSYYNFFIHTEGVGFKKYHQFAQLKTFIHRKWEAHFYNDFCMCVHMFLGVLNIFSISKNTVLYFTSLYLILICVKFFKSLNVWVEYFIFWAVRNVLYKTNAKALFLHLERNTYIIVVANSHDHFIFGEKVFDSNLSLDPKKISQLILTV